MSETDKITEEHLLRTKTLTSGSKCLKLLFIFTSLCLISAEWT